MVGTITGSFLDVFISQTLVGLVGLYILWKRWREAVRLKKVLRRVRSLPAPV